MLQEVMTAPKKIEFREIAEIKTQNLIQNKVA